MRFVIAIVLFAVAAVSIGLGVAQRTVLRGPDHLSASVDVTDGAPFTVIDGATLNANPGTQLVEVTGTASSPVFLAYGRTDDVLAWLEGEQVTTVSYDPGTAELTTAPLSTQDQVATDAPTDQATDAATPAPTETAAAAEAPAGDAASAGTDATSAASEGVSPVGSDLWIQEYSGEGSLVRKISVPADVSLLIATDGTAAAPERVSITWPLDNSTPWSSPLVIGGMGVLLLGLVALIWALMHARRRHGPRRKTPRMPKPPRPAQLKPAPRRAAITTGAESHGRRRAFVALPFVLGSALVLSACTADGAVAPSSEPTSVAAGVAEVEPPVVTKQQFTRIIARTAEVIQNADAAGDAALAAERLSGPALAQRTANYAARAADSTIPLVAAFPSGEVSLILPQQQHDWPRSVFAAVKDADGNDYGLMFVQSSPREPYTVDYLVRLTQSIPEVAPVDLGASRYPTDTKLLAYPPLTLAAEYGDVLINGDSSSYASHFDATDDLLQSTFGAAYKEQRRAEVPNAVIEFTSAAGDEIPIALATNDTGAIITVELRETETVKPAETGAAVSPKGAVKALSQTQTTTKGIAAEYSMQILFYVPPATATDQKARVIGFTQALVAASEVP
ncbi:MAG: hypothetical protein QM675_08895 [Protaetiibacter sp.]